MLTGERLVFVVCALALCRRDSGAADVSRRVGHQRHVPRVLECDTQAALVLGAGTRLSPWLDFTTVGKIATQA